MNTFTQLKFKLFKCPKFNLEANWISSVYERPHLSEDICTKNGSFALLPSKEAPTSKEALELAGLNWKVLQKPIYTSSGIPIKGYKANVRETDQNILGIVTDRYKVVQNDEAFKFNFICVFCPSSFFLFSSSNSFFFLSISSFSFFLFFFLFFFLSF